MKKCRYCHHEDEQKNMFRSIRGVVPELDWYRCWKCEYDQRCYFGLYDEAEELYEEMTGKLAPFHSHRCSGCAKCDRGE